MADEFLGSAVLRLGSKDSASTGSSVAELQIELRRVGVLQPNEAVTEGKFDAATDLAVRRLQWFAGNVPGSLTTSGAYANRVITQLGVDGMVGPKVKQFLLAMKTSDQIATGLLVRVDFAGLGNTSPNSGFTALLDGNRNLGLCEREFAAVVASMNSAASQFGVFVFVNQLFRVEGNAVSGAVVPPAGSSAHKIGRAVDLQLGTSATLQAGVNPQLSSAIKSAAANTPFGKFRDHLKTSLNCRYGGDFSVSDPPHFDQQILPGGSEIWKFHHFFDQLQYRQALVNSAAIPAA